ncbi:DUF4190 domain-containing protein [Demequina sp. SYSU T00192]|uniref:DUF4190 domain-containing protein n=1 Tax=Demequina litoralis TaxID=3051660 RepID=A0ABT8G9N5_9MICO|nr:DUF4190 domain-containing protein [Demequina sp. SYSU T00192]MDN4475856.1 DUF4190 domain-containing protein [Demequina sp. SYSU T00192]
MTTNDDPYLHAQGEGTMRPVQPSPPAEEGWVPQPESEMTVAPPAPFAQSTYTQPTPQPTPTTPAPSYSSPGYAAPTPQQPYYGGSPTRATKTWMNVTSLVCALLVPVVGSLLAIIFGHLGVAASKRGDAEYKGIGIAGLVLGYLGLVGGIVSFLYAISIVADASTVTVQ